MTPHASFLAAGLGVFVATHVARAEPPAATPFARLAARPCASTEGGRAAAEASDWDAAVSAYRVELPDDVGLPAAGRADRVLLQALDVARGAACTVEKTGVPAPLLAQVKGETAAARSGVVDQLRGLVATELEIAGRTEDARPLWTALRAAERPSRALVRAWLAAGDTSAGGELDFTARQHYQRALDLADLEDTEARCYAAWRLAEVVGRTADAAAARQSLDRARTLSAERPEPTCRWVHEQIGRTAENAHAP